MKLALISVLAYCCVAQVTSGCPYHPRLWCSSLKIAEECGVSKRCKSWFPESIKVTYPKVNFSLYYETMCPDSKKIIGNQVLFAYSYLSDIMNLTLVPYGNAQEKKVGDSWVFTCQHGPDECRGNMLETCALNVLEMYADAFYLITCTEANKINVTEQAFLLCAKVLQLDISQVLACANGTHGNQLEHQMALQTDALNPPHTFVPWVTLNGVHTAKIQKEAETNLVKLICDTYTGPKPAICPA